MGDLGRELGVLIRRVHCHWDGTGGPVAIHKTCSLRLQKRPLLAKAVDSQAPNTSRSIVRQWGHRRELATARSFGLFEVRPKK